jgi:hypothetical protein
MIVIKVCMWPQGDPSKERILSIGTLALVGVAKHDAPVAQVLKGERAYQVRLFKDTLFGGPDGSDPNRIRPAPLSRDVWRAGGVRGHMAGPRGAWDLLGGALGTLLGPRLAPYVSWDTTGPGEAIPDPDEVPPDAGSSGGPR